MTAVAPAPRRAALRHQPAFGTVYHLDPGPNGPGLGLVWNLSTCGVGLLVPVPAAPGTRINGTLATEDGRDAVAIDLEVVHVRQVRTGDFYLGARFSRPLSGEELSPFVTPPAPERRPAA